MPKKGKKRKNLRNLDSVYGEAPKPMRTDQLPTYKDVGLQVNFAAFSLNTIQFIFTHIYVQVQHFQENGLQSCEAIKKTVEKISDIYEAASIKTIDQKTITAKVRSLLEMKRAEEKLVGVIGVTGKPRSQGKQKRRGENGKVKQKLGDVINKLFEVQKEVPELEREFYLDQQTTRKLFIGGIDEEETELLVQESMEKEKEEMNQALRDKAKKKREEKAKKDKKRLFEKVKWDDVPDLGLPRETENDDEEEPLKKRRRMSKDDKKNVHDYLAHCDRFKVSECAASAILNLHQEQQNKEQRFTQSQVHRLKRKARLEKIKQLEQKKPIAIGFDERVDWTKKQAGVGSKGRKRFQLKKEEHCVVILYPEEEFAGHVVPTDGNGATLATAITDHTTARDILWDLTKNLLSDGCEKMVGWKKGVHVTFEKIKGKPYGRIICFFHHLEKTFEVIFLLYTGGTTGPGSYSGDIGKSISGDVHTLPLEVFTILPNPSLLKVINLISEETIQSLSNDHKIFLGLIKIVITGEVVKRWVDMKIGPVVTSRFTTTQTRVVRVWLSTANPSFELTRVMHYLVYVWAEVFLTVKHLNQFVDAPRLLLLEVMLTSKHCSYPETTLGTDG